MPTRSVTQNSVCLVSFVGESYSPVYKALEANHSQVGMQQIRNLFHCEAQVRNLLTLVSVAVPYAANGQRQRRRKMIMVVLELTIPTLSVTQNSVRLVGLYTDKLYSSCIEPWSGRLSQLIKVTKPSG